MDFNERIFNSLNVVSYVYSLFISLQQLRWTPKKMWHETKEVAWETFLTEMFNMLNVVSSY